MNHLKANWAAPTNVQALTTTRTIGFSNTPYEYSNLALYVEDTERDVLKNRKLLKESLQITEPIWLNQTHTNRCIVAEKDKSRDADAIITRQAKTVLAILTADCLPILITNTQGDEIAAIHAGWKGLHGGIIENTLDKMQSHPAQLIAWMGPAICYTCYPVNELFKENFLVTYPFSADCFTIIEGKIHFNLTQLAILILKKWGLTTIYQSYACTYEQKNEFYSYRRTPQTGRIASLIWFD